MEKRNLFCCFYNWMKENCPRVSLSVMSRHEDGDVKLYDGMAHHLWDAFKAGAEAVEKEGEADT